MYYFQGYREHIPPWGASYIYFTAVKHKYCLARDQGVKLLYLCLIASLLHPGRIIWLLFSARDMS